VFFPLNTFYGQKSLVFFLITHFFLLSNCKQKVCRTVLAVGVFIYAGTGALCLALGGNFLDYSVLSKILPLDPVSARSFGILMVEVGVGIAVMGSMIWIYCNVASAGRYREGL